MSVECVNSEEEGSKKDYGEYIEYAMYSTHFNVSYSTLLFDVGAWWIEDAMKGEAVVS